jgi:hypothetical protein
VSEVTTYFEWEFREYAFSFEVRSDSHSKRRVGAVDVHYRAVSRQGTDAILI